MVAKTTNPWPRTRVLRGGCRWRPLYPFTDTTIGLVRFLGSAFRHDLATANSRWVERTIPRVRGATGTMPAFGQGDVDGTQQPSQTLATKKSTETRSARWFWR